MATATSANLSTCNSRGQDSTFTVYEGDCGSLIEIACSEDDGCGNGGTLGSVCVKDLIPGNTYFVQFAAATPSDRGLYTLDILCSCEGACCLPPPLDSRRQSRRRLFAAPP